MNWRHCLALVALLAGVSAMFFVVYLGEDGYRDMRALEQKRDAILAQNRAIAMDNEELKERIFRLQHDPAYVESVARRELGMVAPGEIIYCFQQSP